MFDDTSRSRGYDLHAMYCNLCKFCRYVVEHHRPVELERSLTPEPPAAATDAATTQATLSVGQVGADAAPEQAGGGGTGQTVATVRIEAGAFSDAGPDVPSNRRCSSSSSLLADCWTELA